MNKTFYISDWHYGHENIIKFDNRPFSSVENMNEVLIDKWNTVVAKGDTVYVIGDMFWCKQDEAVEVLKILNGQKILIKGNHDRYNGANFVHQFDQICEYKEIDDNGNKIVLCHYPIPCFKNHYYNWYHFYGHVHNGFEWNMMEADRRAMTELYSMPCNMYNVGAMMPYMDYKPRTFGEIIGGAHR